MATKQSSSAAKSPRRSSSGRTDDRTEASESSSSPSSRSAKRGDGPRTSASRKTPGIAIGAKAARQLLELTGRAAEGVTGLERTDDGWKVQVEVVEVRRIPDTTDVLALYEVDVDPRGELMGYRRLRRYSRGASRAE
jgi:hypothetical protein